MGELAIGIAAKNEEALISDCLRSVELSLKKADKLNAPVVVCLNGCVDNTEDAVRNFVKTTDCNIEIIVSEKQGLVNAQREIVSAVNADTYIFVDADSTVSINTVSALMRAIRGGAKIAYTGNAYKYNLRNYITRLHELYASRVFLNKRKYFHGRCFAISDWNIPEDDIVRLTVGDSDTLHKTYGGITCDDVYLSAYTRTNYGDDAIVEVGDAIATSYGIDNLRDWWNTYRRVYIGVKKTQQWFPELVQNKKTMYRKTNWRKWMQTKNIPAQINWLVYLTIFGLFKKILMIELLFTKISASSNSTKEQWRRIYSTKLQRQELILFDVDETLISGNIEHYLDDKLKLKISQLMKKNKIIGLCTHRSFKESAFIHNSLNLNGPLLCEGGAQIYTPAARTTKHAYRNMPYKIGETSNTLFKSALPGIKQTVQNLGYDFIPKSVYATKGSKAPKVVVYSDDRNTSTSLYAYKDGKPSRTLANTLMTHLKEFLPRGLAVEKSNARSSKLHIKCEEVSKLKAAIYVRNTLYPASEIVLIGDDEHDDSAQVPKTVSYLGVANSSERYKKYCSYTATQYGSKGLGQILSFVEDGVNARS